MRSLLALIAASTAAMPPGVAVLRHDELVAGGASFDAAIQLAFGAGESSYGLVIIKDIPGFAEARRAALNATIRLARSEHSPSFSHRVRSPWPGLRNRFDVDDPLQGGFLHNALEEVGPAEVDPIFGKNPWPNNEYKAKLVAVNALIWNVTRAVLGGTDRLVEVEAARRGVPPPAEPLGELLSRSSFMYALMKVFRAEFSRGDDLFDDDDEVSSEFDPISGGGSSMPTFEPIAAENHFGSCTREYYSKVPTAVVAPSCSATAAPAEPDPASALSSMRTHQASSRRPAATEEPASALSSMRTHQASSRRPAAAEEPASALSSMRTHQASSRRASEAPAGGAAGDVEQPSVEGDAAAEDVIEPFWLPWHLDPNTISTLTGDAYFDFETSTTLTNFTYPSEGLGLLAMNPAGDVVHLSPHIDDSSLVVMMAAGAQMHTGGLLRGCLHAVKREGAPEGYARAMYYQAWYGPNSHRFVPPPAHDPKMEVAGAGTAADQVRARRIRSIVDPIVHSMQNRTSRTVLLDFRRQFQRLPVGNEVDGGAARFERLVQTLPPLLEGGEAAPPSLTIDVITDLVCPIAYLGLQRLTEALRQLGWGEGVARVRFHPLLLNPAMAPEGEAMDSYMRRRRNLTLEEYHSPQYPLHVAAAALNYSYEPDRRVINSRRAHYAVAAAAGLMATAAAAAVPAAAAAATATATAALATSTAGRVYRDLARRYFEYGEDISSVGVILKSFASLGLPAEELALRRALDDAEVEVMRAHRSLDGLVTGVPTFVVRDGASGAGLELEGPLEVTAFVAALRRVHAAPSQPPRGDGFGLLQPPGAFLPGFAGKPTLVAEIDRLGGASISSVNLEGWQGPAAWPYAASDFARDDERDDALKYAAPNLVTHVDEPALAALTATYAALFRSYESGAAPLHLLDVGASWRSHYPQLPNGTRVSLMGLNAAELAANPTATEPSVVLDLNGGGGGDGGGAAVRLPYATASFDFVTCAASVAYLTRPREAFAELHRVLKPGGVAVMSFSNRCFAEKATKLWLDHMDEEVALCSIVRNYFYFGPRGGWAHVSSADISPHPSQGDPMWIVTAVKA